MIHTRLGTQADFDAAFDIWRAANEVRTGQPASAEHADRVRPLAGKPTVFLAVAEHDGVVVGMAVGMQALENDGLGDPIEGLCHMSLLAVTPARWGDGIGTAVLNAIIAEASARTYERIQLWTQVENGRAQRLYERHGFHRSGRVKLDDVDGEEIMHYERVL